MATGWRCRIRTSRGRARGLRALRRRNRGSPPHNPTGQWAGTLRPTIRRCAHRCGSHSGKTAPGGCNVRAPRAPTKYRPKTAKHRFIISDIIRKRTERTVYLRHRQNVADAVPSVHASHSSSQLAATMITVRPQSGQPASSSSLPSMRKPLGQSRAGWVHTSASSASRREKAFSA